MASARTSTTHRAASADGGSRRSADQRISAAARRQRGLVTYAQLRDEGLTTQAIARRVQAGRLHRVHARVYGVGYRSTARLVAETAAMLAAGPDAVLSHRSAAVAWGLLPARAGLPVDVTVPRARRVRQDGIRAHRTLRPFATQDTVIRDGLRMTTPHRTILDLAGTAGPVELAKAVDAAFVGRRIRPGELQPRAGQPGAVRLRAVLEGRGLTRSGLERRFLALVRRAGLPAPDSNVIVAGHEVDAVWREQRVAVELDTLGTHATRVLTDREKDLALREAGFDTLRLTDVLVDEQPERAAVAVAAALAAATR